MGSELRVPADPAGDVRTTSQNSFLLTLVAAAAILLANLGTILAVRSQARQYGFVSGSGGPAMAGDAKPGPSSMP
jgi:hypothetical protein